MVIIETEVERESERKRKKSTERGRRVHASRLMKTSRNEQDSISRAQEKLSLCVCVYVSLNVCVHMLASQFFPTGESVEKAMW